jgi:sn-glycerol 3-phosphate transport system substrate-binding protein
MRRRRALQGIAGALSALPLAGSTACGRAASDGRVQASLWYAYGGKNREVLLALLDEFHRSQRRFFIHATYQGDYFECLAKLRTAIAARAAPTVTHVVGEVLPYLAEAGVLDELGDVERDGALDLVPELAQEKAFFGGRDRPLYGLPFNRSTPIVYYNVPLLERLGLSVPRTWDELRSTAQAATVRSGRSVDRWGFACPVDWWFWIALVGQAGGLVVGPKGEPLLGGEAGVQALRFWQTLVQVDRTMKPPPGRDYNAWQATHSDFLAQRAAMIWTSTAFLRYLEGNAKFPLRAAPLPVRERASVPTGGTLFVMPRGAQPEARAAGLAFLRWMMLPEQANAFATRTGYIPVSRAGIQRLEREGYYRDHPNDRVAIDQLAHAQPWPWSTNLFRIQREAVQPRLEEAVLGRRDPERALEDARRAALDP